MRTTTLSAAEAGTVVGGDGDALANKDDGGQQRQGGAAAGEARGLAGRVKARVRSKWARCSAAEVQAFCIRNFLPMGLATALIVGLSWPWLGQQVAAPQAGDYGDAVPMALVVGIFVISGLTLKTDDIKQAVSKQGRGGTVYGLVSILALTPLIGFGTIQLPFPYPEFAYGLTVFAAVPTTLASGVSMVTQAGGNGALALLLTVITNLTAVVTTPFWLQAMFASTSSSTNGAKIDAVSLLKKLLVTVLVPLVFGKLCRELIPGAKGAITKHKVKLGVCNNLFLTLIVWMTISDAADELLAVSFGNIVIVILCGIGLHICFLALNWPVCSRLLKLPLPEFKAVTIMSSQKTLPLSVTIIGYLTGLGQTGLMTLPCIVGHMSQLFIDSGLQSMWLAQAARREAAAAAAAASAISDSSSEEGEPGEAVLSGTKAAVLSTGRGAEAAAAGGGAAGEQVPPLPVEGAV